MKTRFPVASLLNAKPCLRYSILLGLSVSLIASTGLTEDLNQVAAPSTNSRPINSLQATIQLGAGVFPQAVVVSPNSQTIYVGSQTSSGGLISVIDSQTDTITATIPVGGAFDDFGITPDGSTLYVLRSNPAAVSVISTATNAVNATVDLQGVFLAVSPNGKQVYVTDGLQGISIINTATNQVDLDAIPTPAGSQEIALTPDGQTAYVGTFSPIVQAIDLATGKIKATIPLRDTISSLSYLTVSPNGKRLFINYIKGTHPNRTPKQNLILQVNTSTNKAINTIGVTYNFNFGNSAITPDGKYLYVPGAEVLMLNTVTNKIADRISVGGGVLRSVALAPSAPFACAVGFYGNNDEGELYVIDISPE
jgi:YVTN family beta-propeller protein